MNAGGEVASLTGDTRQTDTLMPGEHGVTACGIELRYHVAGRGPVCLIHPGGPGVGWEYMKMPKVEEFMTLVYLEPVGTGSSGRLDDPRGYTLDLYARLLEGFIEHLEEREVYLLGHSHGGFVAQRYALRRPERLSGLILYDTSPTTTGDFWADVEENLGRFAERNSGEPWLEDVVSALEEEMSVATSEGATDERLTQILRRQLPVYVANYADREDEFAPLAERLRLYLGPGRGEEPVPFDTRDELGSIAVPTLILVGGYDPICSPRWARVLHGGIAGSDLAVFGRSGHFPHLEQPESFSGAIREWLGRSAHP